MRRKLPKAANLLLLTVIAASAVLTWAISGSAPLTVTLPVMAAQTPDALTPVEQYRLYRDETELRDLSALESICGSTQLDPSTREDAARAVQALVSRREAQLALEGALLESGFSPCVAVVTPDSVTIVTPNADVSDRDNALLLTLCRVHAGVGPAGVRVICTDQKTQRP